MVHSEKSICVRCGHGGRYSSAGGCVIYGLIRNSRRVITVSECDDFEEVVDGECVVCGQFVAKCSDDGTGVISVV